MSSFWFLYWLVIVRIAIYAVLSQCWSNAHQNYGFVNFWFEKFSINWEGNNGTSSHKWVFYLKVMIDLGIFILYFYLTFQPGWTHKESIIHKKERTYNINWCEFIVGREGVFSTPITSFMYISICVLYTILAIGFNPKGTVSGEDGGRSIFEI